jgi:hypothetical protein
VEAHVTSRSSPPGPDSAIELDFGIEDAKTVERAAVPTICFALRITGPEGGSIRSVLLDVQVQIAARRRQYDDAEQARLAELFGVASRWATTLRTLLWLRTTQVVPAFTGDTRADLHVPCTYDFEVTAAKYLQALDGGEVPLEFLFSGTVFYAAPDGPLQAARISWEKEAEYRLPVAVWRATMDHYFPDSAWLRLSRDAFDRLVAYRGRNALPSWEEVIDSLVPADGEREG